MDEATAVMGCTPAYLAVIVQNIAEAGAAEGLDPELAYELVLESFAGTIELLRRYDPIEVRGVGRLARRRAPRPGSRRSPTPASATASRRRSGPRSSGCAVDVLVALTRGDIADYVVGAALRLLRPDHRQRRAQLGAAVPPDPVQHDAARGARLHRGHDQPVPEPVPLLRPADRPARHQPDRRDPRALDRRRAWSST